MSNVDEQLLFTPGLKYSEIKWDNDDALIEAFKDRVKGFYLDPAKCLNDSEKYAFATGVLCVSTIDLLACITISCNSRTVGMRFKQWLKEHITAFDNSDPNSDILADKFYDEFRNGLVHEGRIKNVGQFSYDKKEELVHILKEMNLFSWDEIPGNDDEKLLDFVNRFYGIDWVEKPVIEKINGGKIICISTKKNHISLKLEVEKNKAILKINELRDKKDPELFTEILDVKKESGRLNIYKVIISVNPGILLEEVNNAFNNYINKVKSDSSEFSKLKTYLKRFKGEIEYANSRWFQNYNKPQINADERRFVHRVRLRLIDHLTPQRTQRAQSITAMFFASFAFFAVRFLQNPNRLLDTKSLSEKSINSIFTNEPQRTRRARRFFKSVSVFSVLSVVNNLQSKK
ncbi:MAG: hypothetical protein OIN66_00255 [Candidatus Methanoperedens sp.]|nr:hypothetical protein [Candidatus Methanoperedens sp.]